MKEVRMVDTKLEITNLITPLVNAYKTISNEWKHLLDIGVGDYLYAQTLKYYFTNTFIHRDEKIRFYDIYYPVKGHYKKLVTDFQNLGEIFENYKNFTIVGSAGSGKTTLLRHIFLKCIKEKIKIPILIELRNLNEFNGDLEQLISSKVLKARIKPSDDTFRRALESGSFLFLLDGYDEIFSRKKQDIKRQIESFVDSYSRNNFLMTTRPGSGIQSFPSFYDFQICELTNDDVSGFINKIVDDLERRNRIKEVIRDRKNFSYEQYLKNPLLLSMFILAFESHPEIPNKKSAFYRNVFDTLYSRHDGITKNSFQRERKTNLQREDFEKILYTFSYLTIIEGDYSYTYEELTDLLKFVGEKNKYKFNSEDLINDLQTSISILILDGFEYKLPHRSMQEYFAAQFVTSLPTGKKPKAYNNLRTAFNMASLDGSFNFWSLCHELDPIPFISNFIIPALSEFLKKLEGKTGRELIYAFLEANIASFYYHDAVDQEKGELLMARYADTFDHVVEFLQIHEDVLIYTFPEHPTVKEKILAFYGGIDNIDTQHGLWEQEGIINILLEYKFDDIIERYKAAIIEKISKLKTEINKAENDIDDLLAIT